MFDNTFIVIDNVVKHKHREKTMGPTQDQNQPIQTPANKPKAKTKTFVGLIVLVLLVVAISAFAWSKISKNDDTVSQESSTEDPAELPATATMTVEANKDVVKVGEVVDFAIYIDSGETETSAVGVVATYPSDTFELESISYEGSKFGLQAEETVKKGSIVMERGVSIKNGEAQFVTGRALVATVKLRPIKATTDGALTINEKSLLLAAVNAQNILGERNEAKIEIAEE